MDLLDIFPSIASLPLNSSSENNQTSSSSPRSPPLPPHSKVASICIVLVVTIIILGTVVGNVLVVVAVFTSRALRAPQNLFLVSLASADILVATLVIPFSLANEVSPSQPPVVIHLAPSEGFKDPQATEMQQREQGFNSTV